MCHCRAEIDKIGAHYRQLAALVTDKQTLEGIDILIAKLDAEKRSLHPEEGTGDGA
jgi:hypothetical protein